MFLINTHTNQFRPESMCLGKSVFYDWMAKLFIETKVACRIFSCHIQFRNDKNKVLIKLAQV